MTPGPGTSRSGRLHRAVCGGLVAALSGFASPLAQAQGWRPEPRGLTGENETVVNVLPQGFGSSVDNLRPVVSMRPNLPEPRDQGETESCVGWTMGYGLLSFLQKRKAKPFSPTYVYRWALSLTEFTSGDKWNHIGVDFPEGFAALSTQGSCTFGPPKMSFVQEGTLTKVVFEPLPPDWIAEGRQQRLKFKEDKLPQHNIVNAMRKALSEGRPLPCGFKIPSKLRNGVGLERMEGKTKPCLLRAADPGLSIMHAMLVVGYDDNQRVFEVMNSFGKDFADEGYLWISYNLIADLGTDAKSRVDNPCLIAAWDYQWAQPETSFEDLRAGFDRGETAAWVRLADRSGEVNFRGDNPSEPVIASLKKNDTLAATQAITVRDAYNASGKAASSNTIAIRTLRAGEKVVVEDMNILESKGGREKEYWIKVKRDR